MTDQTDGDLEPLSPEQAAEVQAHASQVYRRVWRLLLSVSLAVGALAIGLIWFAYRSYGLAGLAVAIAIVFIGGVLGSRALLNH